MTGRRSQHAADWTAGVCVAKPLETGNCETGRCQDGRGRAAGLALLVYPAAVRTTTTMTTNHRQRKNRVRWKTQSSDRCGSFIGDHRDVYRINPAIYTRETPEAGVSGEGRVGHASRVRACVRIICSFLTAHSAAASESKPALPEADIKCTESVPLLFASARKKNTEQPSDAL